MWVRGHGAEMKKNLKKFVAVALVVVLLFVCYVFYSNARPLTARSGWSEWSQAVRHSLSDALVDQEKPADRPNGTRTSEPLYSDSQAADRSIPARPGVAEHGVSQSQPYGTSHSVSQSQPYGTSHSVSQSQPDGTGHSVSQSQPDGTSHSVSQSQPDGTGQSGLPGGQQTLEPLNWRVSTPLPSGRPKPGPTASNSERRGGGGGGHTYIITRTYGGQLTRAIKNLMMQQCWAWGLGMQASIVEPFSSKSLLLHTPALWDALRQGTMVDAARFSDYFDLEFYNHVSAAQRGVPLTIWEDFLTHAPRQAVVVATPMASCEAMQRRGTQSSTDKNFEVFVEGLELLKFQVVKRVVIDCSDSNRGQKLTEELSPFLSNATLVFSSWRSYGVVKTWLSVDSQCDASGKHPAERLAPSSRIQEHMKSYRSNVLRANKTIAIMLRVERFLTLKSSGRSNETVDSCLRKTLAVYAGLKRQPQWADSEPYLTLDIGRFGSGIMQKEEAVSKFGESLKDVTKLVTDLLVKVYDGRWGSILQWEDSFLEATGGVHERGYVAMLQRGIAVQSDCLVLMGGGSYQEVAATQYLEAHPGPGQQCLHIVCAATALTTSLSTRRKKAALSPHNLNTRSTKTTFK